MQNMHTQKRAILTEKQKNGMVLEKQDFPPESGNVSTMPWLCFSKLHGYMRIIHSGAPVTRLNHYVKYGPRSTVTHGPIKKKEPSKVNRSASLSHITFFYNSDTYSLVPSLLYKLLHGYLELLTKSINGSIS